MSLEETVWLRIWGNRAMIDVKAFLDSIGVEDIPESRQAFLPQLFDNIRSHGFTPVVLDRDDPNPDNPTETLK